MDKNKRKEIGLKNSNTGRSQRFNSIEIGSVKSIKFFAIGFGDSSVEAVVYIPEKPVLLPCGILLWSSLG